MNNQIKECFCQNDTNLWNWNGIFTFRLSTIKNVYNISLEKTIQRVTEAINNYKNHNEINFDLSYNCSPFDYIERYLLLIVKEICTGLRNEMSYSLLASTINKTLSIKRIQTYDSLSFNNEEFHSLKQILPDWQKLTIVGIPDGEIFFWSTMQLLAEIYDWLIRKFIYEVLKVTNQRINGAKIRLIAEISEAFRGCWWIKNELYSICQK